MLRRARRKVSSYVFVAAPESLTCVIAELVSTAVPARVQERYRGARNIEAA